MRLTTAFLPSLSAVALLGACDRAPETAPVQRTATVVDGRLDFSRDDRVAHLMGGCQRADPFTGDPTDLIAVQVQKIVTAEAIVASRARADLIAAGEAAVPELRRAFQRWFTEPGHAPRLLALLDLAATTRSPEARSMALEGLEHPSESVRTSAARALASFGDPADYDRLAAQMPQAGLELASEVGQAMMASDPARLEAEYPAWLEDPRRQRVAELLAPKVAPQSSAELRARVLAGEKTPPVTRLRFLAASAAAGDAAALEELRTSLSDDNDNRRQITIQALLENGLAAEVVGRIGLEKDAAMRTMAVEAAASLPDSPALRSEIASALSDVDETVRRAALSALVARGDAGAIDRAIELLAGSSDEVRLALGALRARLARDPELAARVLARLEELLEGGSKTSRLAIERAIGQVPLPRAARLLIERGRVATEPIQELPAHRWYALQATNTGPEGRAWLRSQWDGESDVLRRMDLIGAGTQESDPAVTAFLEHVLTSPRTEPWERLFTAELLARLVPARVAMPVLQRASGMIAVPEAQRALNCLMWRFWGPERG